MAIHFERPENPATRLEVEPRLASWMAQDHPDQARLSRFLDHAERAVEDRLSRLDGPLALRLDVGLSPGVELLRHHDLDNYLYPLIARLGPRRFASAWATKTAGGVSSIRVDRARPRRDVDQAALRKVRTSRSAETVAWKQQVLEQLAGAGQLPAGPVALQLSFRVGPARNWANLWKPTIDSLAPILGSDGPRPWNPQDGRIVLLGLHQEVDPSIGHAVEIAVHAAIAPSPHG